MKKFRKPAALAALFIMLMTLLTGCGYNFNGSWECVEANVSTYGLGILDSAYDVIESAGMVDEMCRLEIDGDDIEYYKSMIEYDVVNVYMEDDRLEFDAVNSFGYGHTVTARLIDGGDQLLVWDGDDDFVLEKSSFWGVVIGIIAFLVIGFIAFVIFAVVLASKRGKNPNSGMNSGTSGGMSSGMSNDTYENPFK